MPIWLYQLSPFRAGLFIIAFIETVSLAGLFLFRRYGLPRLRYTEDVNDAVSGTVQAIGVFYGITVGLIAVGVWNTYSSSAELVSKEAASIGALYRDVSSYPAPVRDELRSGLRDYTIFVLEQAWPSQKKGEGQNLHAGVEIIGRFQAKLYAFEPSSPGQVTLHNETVRAYNTLLEYRNLRIDAVGSGLSPVMWAVIWIGAAISIGVAYFFNIQDPKLHTILVALMAGFLAMVLLMIIINDKPFYGYVSISSDPYKLILERLINQSP